MTKEKIPKAHVKDYRSNSKVPKKITDFLKKNGYSGEWDDRGNKESKREIIKADKGYYVIASNPETGNVFQVEEITHK